MILEYILLAILLVCALIIVVAVVFQKSNEGLSGTIAGGAETFFGKSKGSSMDKILSKLTIAVSVATVVVVVALVILITRGASM